MPLKNRYTIELHRAMYTDELFEVYKRYEKAIHNRDVKPSNLRSHLCNSPVYHPSLDLEFAQAHSNLDSEGLDESRIYKDEGVRVIEGSYHMYHRLNGKLVAVGNIDILRQCFNSGYFLYDPEYRFLNLGVVGALKEIEYMRKLKSPQLVWYILSDMVPVCPKVNYKIQY